jgi:Rieske Fe-S protein
MSESFTAGADDPTRAPGRRVFLRVLGAAAACLASSACVTETGGGTTSGHGASGTGAGGGGGGGGGSCAGGTLVGDSSHFVNSGLYLIQGTSVMVGRDSGGVYALSSVCTHQGCDLNVDGQLIIGGIRCLCHGSIFTLTGQVEVGPAFSPLPAFAITESCGQLFVNTSELVPSTQRLAV